MSKNVDTGGFTGESREDRIETLYFLAESYDEVGTSEVNPSFHALREVEERYVSPELIAEGGMKQIFKVYDARGQRDLAMAMLRENASEDLCDPFIHEAWLTARLDHPNIITVHDVGATKDGRPYFTMDLKKGYSLHELIDKLRSGNRKMQTRYPMNALLDIFLKICDAVSYAHSIKVVHLDLKPANIQIGEYGRVLVCDWGLAKVIGGNDLQEIDRILFNPDLLGSINLFGQIKGTPGYMAPEQLNEDGEVDVRTDVYGLGCILYSMLTLMHPFSGDAEEVIKQTLEGSVVPPNERASGRNIPEGLDAVVMKAIAVDPEKRYASVDILQEEVRRYLTGFATEAEHAGIIRQLSLFYRRNRQFCITVACLILIIVAGTLTAFWQITKHHRMAESTLALYEAGQNKLGKVNIEKAESIANLARRYEFQNGTEKRAEAILLTALDKDPGNKLLMRAMGEHYFMLQEFKKALPYLAEGTSPYDDVMQTASFYSKVKTDEQRLDTQQVIDVIQRILIHEPLISITVLYDQRTRFELDQRAEIINAYLHAINPDWKNGWFEYDSMESHLRLGGKGLKRVSTQQSVLLGLNPRYLDLSGSEVEELWNETRLATEVLDIRGTPMQEIWFLKRFVHLRELIISPGQFTPDQLQELPERVRVMEKPLD